MAAKSERRRGQTEPGAERGSEPGRSVCPQCGDPLPAHAVACPKCLMGLALTDTLPDGAVSEAAMSRAIGGLPHQFGRYSIVRRLGQGAMGVVYLAKDSQLDRFVAIKVPLFGTSSETAVVERFKREVRAAAALQHPNICTIHDVGETDGTLYMTMAYIEGQSLAERLAVGQQLSMRQSVELIRTLAGALAEAHRKGVIHRDLKPANIMIDERNEPLIMDFGLARRNRHEDLKVTRSGTLLGTPAYMPPEQVKGNETLPASDIYSLGVILYELLARRLPFEGELVDVLNSIVQRPPRPPSAFHSQVSSQLDAICLQALAKETDARFATMDEFAQVLTGFLQQIPTPAVSVQPPPKLSRQSARAIPSAVWYGVTATLGCLLALGLLVGLSLLAKTPSGERLAQIPAKQEPAVQAPLTNEFPPETAGSTETPPAIPAIVDGALNNFVMGRYLCFFDGKWQQGLPLLAQSNDDVLRTLAQRELGLEDLSAEALLPEQLALADAWSALSGEEANPSIVAAMRSRAAQWYRAAAEQLTTEEAERVRQWLAEFDAPRRQTSPQDVAAEDSAKTDPAAVTAKVTTVKRPKEAVVEPQRS